MVIIMQPSAGEAEIQGVVERIHSYGMEAHLSRGKERTIIGLIGDEREIDFALLGAHLEGLRAVLRLEERGAQRRQINRGLFAVGQVFGHDQVLAIGLTTAIVGAMSGKVILRKT